MQFWLNRIFSNKQNPTCGYYMKAYLKSEFNKKKLDLIVYS